MFGCFIGKTQILWLDVHYHGEARREKERSYALKLSREFNMRLDLMLQFLQNTEKTFLYSKVI
jgi:hypothetical protein